jgi:acetophenone carboxylase
MNYAIAVYDVPWIFFGSWGFNSKSTVNLGLFGGYASPVAPFVRISNSNLKEMLTSSEAKLPHASWGTYEERPINGLYEADKYPSPPRPVKEYDIVAGGSLGGGGYGDPLERDPSMVMRDIEDGTISHRVAKNVYKVAYDEETLVVDEEKTKALREEERADRRKRGMKFNDFEKEWLKLKPKKEILEFYGEWPEKHYESFTYYGTWHK